MSEVSPQIEIKKIMAYIIYRFAHNHNIEHMANYFKIGASTIIKNVDIVCNILINRDKLCIYYITFQVKTIIRSSS